MHHKLIGRALVAGVALALTLGATTALAAAPSCTSPGAPPTTTAGPPPRPDPIIPRNCLSDPSALQTAPCKARMDQINGYKQDLKFWQMKLGGFVPSLQRWNTAAQAYVSCENTMMTVQN